MVYGELFAMMDGTQGKPLWCAKNWVLGQLILTQHLVTSRKYPLASSGLTMFSAPEQKKPSVNASIVPGVKRTVVQTKTLFFVALDQECEPARTIVRMNFTLREKCAFSVIPHVKSALGNPTIAASAPKAIIRKMARVLLTVGVGTTLMALARHVTRHVEVAKENPIIVHLAMLLNSRKAQAVYRIVLPVIIRHPSLK